MQKRKQVSNVRKKGLIGVALLSVTAAMAILSLFYTPYDPNQMNIMQRFSVPGWDYWLGTDQYGRDILSRIMVAAGNAYFVGLGSVLLGGFIGVVIGCVAGYGKGWVGDAAMRVVDGLSAFPHLLLALLIVAILGVGVVNALIAIGVFNIPLFARLSYGSVLETKQAGYVKAAFSYGAGPFRILFRHILPAASSKLMVQATASFSLAILVEASLSFLGLGVQLPNASWGTMLEDSRKFMAMAPWFPVIPGAAILVTVLGANLLGDTLRQGGEDS